MLFSTNPPTAANGRKRFLLSCNYWGSADQTISTGPSEFGMFSVIFYAPFFHDMQNTAPCWLLLVTTGTNWTQFVWLLWNLVLWHSSRCLWLSSGCPFLNVCNKNVSSLTETYWTSPAPRWPGYRWPLPLRTDPSWNIHFLLVSALTRTWFCISEASLLFNYHQIRFKHRGDEDDGFTLMGTPKRNINGYF